MPGRLIPCFERDAGVFEGCANPEALLASARTVEWMHPSGRIVTAPIDAGPRLDRLHEHDAIRWRMVSRLVRPPGRCIAGPTDPGARSPSR